MIRSAPVSAPSPSPSRHDPVGTTLDAWHETQLADPAYARAVAANDIADQIAVSILRARLALGMSQAELASRVGTSNTAISRLESGGHRPSISTLERVAEALGLRLVIGLEAPPR